MPAAPDARRVAFANFVKRALAQAATARGWSVAKVAEESGVGASTIYRWRNADWKQSPLADQVKDFCNALDIPLTMAFPILWPDKDDRPPDPEPLPMDRDFEVLLRQLADPNVSDDEKFLIRETIRGLANRAVRRRRE